MYFLHNKYLRMYVQVNFWYRQLGLLWTKRSLETGIPHSRKFQKLSIRRKNSSLDLYSQDLMLKKIYNFVQGGRGSISCCLKIAPGATLDMARKLRKKRRAIQNLNFNETYSLFKASSTPAILKRGFRRRVRAHKECIVCNKIPFEIGRFRVESPQQRVSKKKLPSRVPFLRGRKIPSWIRKSRNCELKSRIHISPLTWT